MKGLLLKDLYMMKSYCKAYLVLILIFWIIGASSKDSSFLTIYPCFLVSTIPITLQTYDEKEKWGSYSRTLPYSSGQLVSVKYLLNLMTTLLNLAMILLIRNPEESGMILCSAVPISILPTTFIMPIAFKFDTEKAKLCYIILAIIVGAACGVGFTAISHLTTFQKISIAPTLLAGIILTGTLIIYGISWNISIKIYSRKEFT